MFDKSPVPSAKFLAELEKIATPRSRYIVAITPRSGSSYLCDVMSRVKRFGHPGEFLNPRFIPNILRSIPARNGDDYIRRVVIKKKTPNGLSGLKVSWFQFEKFISQVNDFSYLTGFRYIYLRRRDLSMQAVSLYRATSSDVFHTNVDHSKDKIDALNKLEYNFDSIDKWRQHIIRQEQGWEAFFHKNRIFPLCLFYEDVEEDILRVMKRIATFVEVDPNYVKMPTDVSVFRKVRDERNLEWALRFSRELAARDEKLPSRFGGDA